MGKSVCIIGNGRVGTALERSLSFATNYSPLEIISRNAFEQQKLGIADIYCIATPDKHIFETAQKLVSLGKVGENTLVIHLSGVHTSDLLVQAGIKKGISFHPARSFQKDRGSFHGCIVTIEGSSAGVDEGVALARALGARPIVINGQNKSLYHVATVFSSNFIVALLSITEDLLKESGLREEEAAVLSRDLAASALQNIADNSLQIGLTGPVARGDTATVEIHQNTLKDKPEISQLYSGLTKTLQKMINIK